MSTAYREPDAATEIVALRAALTDRDQQLAALHRIEKERADDARGTFRVVERSALICGVIGLCVAAFCFALDHDWRACGAYSGAALLGYGLLRRIVLGGWR